MPLNPLSRSHRTDNIHTTLTPSVTSFPSRKPHHKHYLKRQHEVQPHHQCLRPRQRWHGSPFFRYVKSIEPSLDDIWSNLYSTGLRKRVCESGTGTVDPCCGAADPNCQSASNCYLHCQPSGPNDIGGPLGCIAGKSSSAESIQDSCAYNLCLACSDICPSEPVC